jgi:hypothetical protein
VQSVLLYSSEMWVLSKAVLTRLEGFHIRAAYKMAKIHMPHRAAHRQWINPPSDKVFEECGMHTIQHYIDVRQETIVQYVMNRSIFAECKEANQWRGSVQCHSGGGGSRGCAWTTLMQLDLVIEPFHSSLELLVHRGMYCRGMVGATGLSVMWKCYFCGSNSWECEHRWVGDKKISVVL